MKKTLLSFSLAALLLGGCASNPTLNADAVFQRYPVVSEAQALIFKAKEDNLAFYSPEQMKEANRVYDNALKDAKSGKASATDLAEEAVVRAETPSNFITKVSEIDNSRVTFNGFGKEKPVASYETAEGRAENRRVEILIVNN